MFENYKYKQSQWVIPERSPKEIYERCGKKCHFPLLSIKRNRKMCSHTFIEVMCYAGQDIFVVAYSRLAYYILFNKNKTFPCRYTVLFLTLRGFLCSYRGIYSIFPSNQFPFNNRIPSNIHLQLIIPSNIHLQCLCSTKNEKKTT